MLLPMKVLAPAEVTEHMPGWSMVSVSIAKQNSETVTDYGISVAVLVSPKLHAALQNDDVYGAETLARQVIHAAERAVAGFLGDTGPTTEEY
jgi:hypothetical protein